MVFSLERWQGKIAVVTGASDGIGEKIVEKLVDAGLKVVGLARRIEKMLKDVSTKYKDKKGSFHPIKCDLAAEEDILIAFKIIKETLGPVSILVNCAGVIGNTNLVDVDSGLVGRGLKEFNPEVLPASVAAIIKGECDIEVLNTAAETGETSELNSFIPISDTQIWRRIYDVNVLGLCIATREAVKIMRENDIDGHIVHINSIAGHKVPYFPISNVYPSSKYAVTALAETLRIELNTLKSKIKVSSVSPGLVDTKIAENAGFPVSHEHHDIMTTYPALKPDEVAEAVIFVLSTPPKVQIQELIIKPLNEEY